MARLIAARPWSLNGHSKKSVPQYVRVNSYVNSGFIVHS
jgi:hypothetical protein